MKKCARTHVQQSGFYKKCLQKCHFMKRLEREGKRMEDGKIGRGGKVRAPNQSSGAQSLCDSTFQNWFKNHASLHQT